MIISLDDIKEINAPIGQKAKNLVLLKDRGFQVPRGIVLSSNVFQEVLKANKIEREFNHIIKAFKNEELCVCHKRLMTLFEQVKLPSGIKKEIAKHLDHNKHYAVRSSGMKEDLERFSFAGQYESFLNVKGIEVIGEKVIDCYRAMFGEGILSYFQDHKMSLSDYAMAVIIQEMVPADKSGVIFSLNPTSGNDKEMVIDVGQGLGDELVSGRTKAETYYYNWYEDVLKSKESNKLLSTQEVRLIAKEALKIQICFGIPVDIEFALKEGELYILQARPITKILYGGIKDQWSTANFKDGGVSSAVCTPYMWSLYEYIWEYSLKAFLLDSKILKQQDLRKLGHMYYGRPYWNMSVVKLAMSKIPGYKEREFDEEFGVNITYKGNGEETKLTIKAAGDMLKMVVGFTRVLRDQLHGLELYKAQILKKYNYYLEADYQNMSYEKLKKQWYTLIKDDNLINQTTYFRQIFVNTVHQTLLKDKLLKVTDKNEYLNLLSGLENISHLLPFHMLWEMSRKIIAHQSELEYWTTQEVKSILRDYNKAPHSKESFEALKRYISLYGYHSAKELDVTYPHFAEDIKSVIYHLKEVITLTDEYAPLISQKRQQTVFQNQLKQLRQRTKSKPQYNKVLKDIHKMRSMLWWREELRDLSTRFYYIIRLYTLELSKHFVKHAVLLKEEDIFFLKIEDIFKYLEGEKSENELQECVKKRHKYYDAYRHFMSENEIGDGCSAQESQEIPSEKVLRGIGCNNMIVKGKARVIESIADIDRIRPGDILVTKFTDTGWTSKFAILSGVVTECGGMLCHAAIVAREYGIACVVCVDHAVSKIPDGSMIILNAATGDISIEK